MDPIALLAIIISLLFMGFLSGIEIAFISANKLSIELNKKQGTYSGKLWSRYAERPAHFITTILVAINVLLVVYGLLVGDMLFPVWQWIERHIPQSATAYVKWIKLLVETILSTSIFLIVEFVFKAYFRTRNNSVISNGIISYITSFIFNIFSSVATLFVRLSEWILKTILNVRLRKNQEPLSKTDLEQFMGTMKMATAEEKEEESEFNKELLDNALSLSDTKLRKCLVPRRKL